MKILHIADIHWRGLSRHEEYILAFRDLFKQARDLKPDIIYVGGDIVHSKTQGISPELIENLIWWFNELADIAPTHIILGNHDGLILNKDRQDAITPIITAINNPNLYLYKQSGTYQFAPGYEWCILSCFDEENWNKAKPNSENISIVLYHGAIKGSLTDIDWQIEGEDSLDLLTSYDFGMLGDIHKRQFLNEKKTIAYPGSTIQQNYGEDSEKGFLLWDIKSKTEFNVEFYPVKNTYQFVTVDWQGSVESTVNKCNDYPNLSRFRIRGDNYISQADTRQLQKILQKQKLATEVVFKIDSKFDADTIQTDNIQNELDLRDPDKHFELIQNYYGETLTDEDKSSLKNLINKSISEITNKDEDLRNVKWSINKLSFDNCFSYGSDNLINFESLPGITGIFGQNARGKSSIIGTIAYSLFNTSDRGSIKNIHIINTRHNFCKAEIDISINNKPYRIVRETEKRQTKSGEWAPTNLKFYSLNKQGDIIEDLTDEQRRETEKVIRGMLGDAESFMMTTLASQGEMNTFIKEKASSRKNILSNFLDLTIFDKMNEYAKKESSELKTKINSFSKMNWDKEISIKKSSIEKYQEKINDITDSLASGQKRYEEMLKEFHSSVSNDYVTISSVNDIKNKWESSVKKFESASKNLDLINDEIYDTEEKITKIEKFLTSFNLEEIKEKRNIKNQLEKVLLDLSNDLKLESKELSTIQKSVDKLNEVPCGDMFPTCKFIKESHQNKSKLEEQKNKVLMMQVKVDDLKENFDKLKLTNFEEQIEKYNTLTNRKSQLISDISNKRVLITGYKKDIENLNPLIKTYKMQYEDLNEKYLNQDKNNSGILLEKRMSEIQNEIKDLDKKRTEIISKLAKENFEINLLEKQKKEFEKVSKDLRVYDLFIQSTSSRGIPVQIINSMLPHINLEIAKILKGIVGFTVELEADLESNSMDIYINYGDSRRIIELGSGMEKMMASLAIRVALINVSTLPKTNILMIDEGFGALDETNLESCGKLLQSLKKYFRNIIVISHIDTIKDIVDNSIDISKKGVDSYVYYP